MVTVGWVGLGAMGVRMAARLLDAGYPVRVWNRTAKSADGLVARGAVRRSSPADAARGADVVITMVADPAALATVTEGAHGVLAGLAPNAILVDMSTVGPAAVARLRDALGSGGALVDAPVLGSLGEAEAGTLRILAGGDAAVIDRVEPVLRTLGEPTHVGASGAGAAAKLVANSTLFGVLGVLGEAIALADALGLSRQVTFDLLTATPIAAAALRRRPAFESDHYPPRFALAMARKDADLVVGAAASAGLRLRLAGAAQAWLRDAEADGFGALDYAAVLATIVRPPLSAEKSVEG